ncbi:GntR family transcriptional regulator [Sinomonas sp. JGH33]|uniref:GntR family transcriptional regulator n=1 Tax=Sinomonas terricola TaxID=3110330 RepID=A0ABU5TA46_9MICC|nr:GntR family transcriptional regulator [Sinomonas sp. JGH33]MEA5455991.1 GntR family transcriptional regulator [Sinomonas sp. JGH33]
MNTVESALRGPLPTHGKVPLRVAAYMRISDAIRSRALPPASLLPSESELVDLLGVSRTVVREALIFLEEDGLIRSRKGIGRFVSEQLPRSGIEKVQAAEVMLADGGTVRVERIERSLQETTASFAAEALHLAESDPSWFIESVILRNETPVALVQEHLPTPDAFAEELSAVAAILADPPPGQTILGAILAAGLRPSKGVTDISAGTAGTHRAKLIEASAAQPVLLLTRTLQLNDRAFYISKILVDPRKTHVSVAHSTF